MRCPYCNEEISKSYLKTKVICQACYLYTRHGGEIHSLPDAGTIVTDPKGYVICHICGQSYNKLGSHIANKHHMSVEDYKEIYSLPQNVSLASAEHKAKMRRYNAMYRDRVVYDNLINRGMNTRFVPGQAPIRRHTKKSKCVFVSLADADTTDTD